MERISNRHNDVVVFHSSAAVGLIVQDNSKANAEANGRFALGMGPKPDSFIGGFYSPEEAREIGQALLRFADDAQADRDRVYTAEDRRALLDRALGRV